MQNSRSEMCYELGGPRVYTYRSLLEVIARSLGKKPLLVPVPFGLWRMLALIAEIFPRRPSRETRSSSCRWITWCRWIAGFVLADFTKSLEDVLPAMMEPPDGVSRVPPVASLGVLVPMRRRVRAILHQRNASKLRTTPGGGSRAHLGRAAADEVINVFGLAIRHNLTAVDLENHDLCLSDREFPTSATLL